MQIAAAYAIASAVDDRDLSVENIMPSALDKHVADVVAAAVSRAYMLHNNK
jgi:malate dehydrogenase (oxaloacetate-decarboxylating)